MSVIANPTGPMLSWSPSAKGGFVESPLEVLTAELESLVELVGGVSDEQYAMRPVGPFESSIGAHVRHCLDHIVAFLGGLETSRIDYELRERGTEVESSRRAAGVKIQRLLRRAADARDRSMDHPVGVTAMLTKVGPPVEVESSVGRELVFTLSHTTHHNAMIAAMAKLLGIETPPGFGVAPSTAAYHDRARCAR